MRLRAIHTLILVLILGAVTFGQAPEPGFDEYVTNAMKEWVKGTSPSLALEKYAGTYQNEMYGATKFMFKDGKLVSEFGPNFNGDLEHWHYDTFRVVWRDRMEGKGFVVFKLNAKGQPETVTIDGLGDFTRVPDKPAPGPVSSN